MRQKMKPYLPYIVITVIGLLIMSIVLPYHYFDWGIKPCMGTPADVDNCGDADFGGVGFIMLGLPIAILGIIGIIARWVINRFWHK